MFYFRFFCEVALDFEGIGVVDCWLVTCFLVGCFLEGVEVVFCFFYYVVLEIF